MSWTNVFVFSHKRAERLIDERIDSRRGEADLSEADIAWLDAHLSTCVRCQSFEAERTKLLGAMSNMGRASAPEGFAGRVLLAAKTRKVEEVPEPETDRQPFGRFAVGGAIAAVALGVFVVATQIDTSSNTTPGGVGVAGHGGFENSIDRPHFVVRSPGVGVAKARLMAVSIVADHNGRYEVVNGAIYAEVPRAELVPIMRNLAKRSRYKVEKSDAGELQPNLKNVLIKFELE